MGNETTIDHIVVAAPNLKSGVQWVRDILGVTPQLGGQHARMGTHNCLLRLDERSYLEVIAIDPNAAHPGRPRWFGLDSVPAPRLCAWVVRTRDIRSSLAACGENLGVVEPMSRGELEWLITVTEDGGVPLGGCAPVLIQWLTATHPVIALRDNACMLVRLDLYHSQAPRLRGLLRRLGVDMARIEIKAAGPDAPPRIEAIIDTPRGERLLASAA